MYQYAVVGAQQRWKQAGSIILQFSLTLVIKVEDLTALAKHKEGVVYILLNRLRQ